MTDTEHSRQQADAAAKQRTEDEKKRTEATKKKLADEREAREKASKASGKAAADSKPTPTQEENDLVASGVPVQEHEDDGSGPDPNTPEGKAKQAEATKALEPKPAQARAGYQTKAQPAS